MLASLIVALGALTAPLSPAPQEKVDGPLFVERRTRIERHPVLGSLGLERQEYEGGLVVYSQPGMRDHTGVIVGLRGIFRFTESAFDDLFVDPAGLKEERERGQVAIVMLRQKALYDRYLQGTRDFCTFSQTVNYDAALGAVVLWDVFDQGAREAVVATRTALHHGLVHALYHAYSGTDGRLVGPYWLTEGMAMHLVVYRDDEREPVESMGLDDLHELLSVRLIEGGYPRNKLQPLGQLLAYESRSSFRDWVLASSPEQDNYASYWQREESLAYVAACLIDLIRTSGTDAQQAALVEHFRAGVLGQRPAAAPEHGFGPGGLAALEQRLWEVLLSLHFEGRPAEPPLPPVGAPEPVLAAFTRVVEGLLDAEGNPMALLPSDPTSTLERAADGLRRGRFESAAALLASLDPASDDGRTGRLATLAQDLLVLRDEGIAALAAEGGRLRLVHGDKPRSMRIESLKGSTLSLRVKKGESLEVQVDDVPLEALARALGERTTPRTALALGFLAGESRWDRNLPEGLAELAGDLESLEAHLELGGFKNDLADFDRRTTGTVDRSTARAALEDLQRLGATVPGGFAGMLDEVHLPLLRDRAKQVLSAAHGPDLIGQDLGSGRASVEGELLVIEYDFEDERQLNDFILDDTFHLATRKSVGEVAGDVRGRVRVEDGVLTLLGSQGLRHRLELGAPMSVSWTLTVKDESATRDPLALFGMILMDSGRGQFVSIANRITSVTFFRSGQLHQVMSEADPGYYPDTPYHLAFEVGEDGRLTGTYNGEQVLEDLADLTGSGVWGMLAQTDHPITVDDLRVTATLTDGIQAMAREGWIVRGLAELGLAP